MKKTLLTLATAVLCSGSAFASGYQVLLQSNRSTAMGNIGVGLRPDPSAINFNPGALAMMRGNGVQIGANLIYSKVAFSPSSNPDETYYTNNDPGTPFHLFAAFGADESNLKFGLGVYTPYGSSVDWGNDWVGRTSLTEISLSAIFIQPTVSFKISDKLSIGAGFIYSIGGVNLQRDQEPISFNPPQFVHAELDGSASGYGYNVGLYFTPNEKISLGINYRSRIDMKVKDGDATFTGPTLVVGEGRPIPSNTSFESELPLPSYLTIGGSYQATEKWLIGADVSYAGWDAYQSLKFTYADPVGPTNETEEDRKYENSWTFKVGTEYAIIDALKLRAGFYYDQSPVQEGYLTAETPDAPAMGYTGGIGYSLSEKLIIDASFLYVNKEQRTNIDVEDPAIDNPVGDYKAIAFIPGISFTYKF